MTVTSDQLLDLFRQLSLQASTCEHEPVHTVAQSQSLRGNIKGVHAKNLFVKDKKAACT